LNPVLQQRCDRLDEAVVFFAQKVIDDARRTKPGNAFAKLDALTNHRQAALAKPDTDYVLMCARMFGTDYVQGQALPEVGDKVAAWLAKHGGFMRPLLGLSLAQQHQVMQDVIAISRDFGDLHYEGDAQAGLGVLELQARTADLFSKERMLDILTRDFALNGTPFEVKPLPLPKKLPARFKNFVIKELLTGNALRREGSDMHHCVGGYSSQIRNNQSRIVSIKHKDELNTPNCSTVEFRGQFHKDKFSEMGITIGQNRTLQNKSPSPRNQELANYLNDYLQVAELIAEGDVHEMAAEIRQTVTVNQQVLSRNQNRLQELEAEAKALKAAIRQQEADAKVDARRDAILQELANDALMAALDVDANVKAMDSETRMIYEALKQGGQDPVALEPVRLEAESFDATPDATVLQRLLSLFGFGSVQRQDPPVAT
jgi:hypothetical protein